MGEDMKKLNKFTLSGTIILLIMSFGVSVGAKEKQGLRNLDKDENGKITFEEFSYKHQKIFNNMDKDSDGFISRDEIDRKREGKNNISRYADRLDLNNDLKIDKNEFIRGQSNRFKRVQKASKNRRHIDSKQRRNVAEKIFESADSDNNGSLNTSELSKVRELAPKVAKNHRFSQVDLDNNNKLTQEEFLAPIKKKFSSMDKNQDSALDKGELRPRSKSPYQKDRRSQIRKRVDRFEKGLKRKIQSGEITEEEAKKLRADMKRKISKMRENQRNKDRLPPPVRH
ncbi:MAG: hypothetical protein CMD59_01955 [Gammaproteobacteria bacterium]|nr:hypothetical protein [Gammaproteobacteria bacterium]